MNAPTKYINFSPKELMINVYLLTRVWRDVMVTMKQVPASQAGAKCQFWEKEEVLIINQALVLVFGT